jgi:hypothetical protein
MMLTELAICRLSNWVSLMNACKAAALLMAAFSVSSSFGIPESNLGQKSPLLPRLF